jgi:signal transduction histidine kinase/DNA-binding LacI/PurR family transcriptional regulator/DNA-binding response OmpR family regulator
MTRVGVATPTRVARRGRPTIGVLASWQAYAGTLHTFLGPLFRGVRSAARDRGCNLLLSCGVGPPIQYPWTFRPAWPVPSADADFVPVGPWNADGLIAVMPFPPAKSRYIQQLIAEGYPVVFAGAGERGPTVVVDNAGGVRKAVEHLVGHRHRRIAFIAAGEYEDKTAVDDSTFRRRAYWSAVTAYGLDIDHSFIACGYNSVPGGRQAMRQLLDAKVPFTAVIASNDESAIGAMEVLQEAGRMVPQDVAVIGFDNRLESVAHVPPLTTVHHPTSELGYQALVLLLEYIEGQAKGLRTVTVPTRLVIRESCGCVSGGPSVITLASSGSEVKANKQAEGGTEIGSQVIQALTEAMVAEMQRMSPDEIRRSCQRLVETLFSGLEQGDSLIFRLVVQQILQRTTLVGDDLHAWQTAVSTLRDNMSALLKMSPHLFTRQQVEALLDQARIAIGETARGQYARHLIRQADVANQVGQMTTRFVAARDEAEIYQVLEESLPGIGIQHAAVALYEPQGEDPVAWSVLQSSHGLSESQRRFPSRKFPPEGLYPQDAPFSLALVPLQVQDDVPGFVAFDAGNLEPCADIVRQLGAALRSVRLYREAVEANRLKSRFLSTVSHELRTPLNLISGLSEVLLQEGEQMLPGKCEVDLEDLKRIYVSAQHLDALIRDVLDLAQSEVGHLKLVREPLDLAELLRAEAVIGEILTQNKGLAWRTEIPENLPRVWGDRTRLGQVVLNLLNNAVKFTTHGEIVLTARTENGAVTVTVQDTGIGIPPEEQEVIFDEFRQSERATARGYGGLGLGLAICKRLVELHGGKIGVQSVAEEGGGSSFYFTLPAMAHQVTLSDAEVALVQPQQVILLVKETRGGDLLKEHLLKRGFEVKVHQVGETTDWLAWLFAGPPEAVVLDLDLASERGWEILKLLKGNPATRDVPVLFYTVAGEEKSGAVLEIDYLTKPVGTTELAEALMSQGLTGRQTMGKTEQTILIVDDEAGVVEMHARLVEMQLPGCRVLKARNGWQALELMRQERPDLVLLDLMMPELDGFGVLEAMRQQDASHTIPVIVLTGQVLGDKEMARLNHGVASVLGKGLFTVQETLEHLEAALTQRRTQIAEGQQLVRKALAFIHEHYAESISRGDVAAYVSLSERHLTRCFRQEMGVTPITYLTRYRVRQAKSLLEAGDKSVTQVALEVGFSDSHYFARVFRSTVGVSPSAYRRGERA